MLTVIMGLFWQNIQKASPTPPLPVTQPLVYNDYYIIWNISSTVDSIIMKK